ncbi:MAG: sigma-70 family RNA polymerase sigma factor [Oscillospiraceae bacterium]|nr:sigma-70 family RNA polymerase sigma factor [Oscillospiraceae bacterium]
MCMEDGQIVELYWQREEAAVWQTQEKYGALCLSVAVGVLSDRADAEECVNDLYIAAWNAMPPHRPGNLAAFLATLTRRIALKRLRMQTAAKRNGGEAALVWEELSECVAGADDTRQAVEARELARSVNAFLATLRHKERRVFLCRYWYFDSVGDIARRFGWGESRVKMTLKRTREKLMRYLKEEGLL